MGSVDIPPFMRKQMKEKQAATPEVPPFLKKKSGDSNLLTGGEQPSASDSVPQSTSPKSAVQSLAERINATVTPASKGGSSPVFGSRSKMQTKKKEEAPIPESFTKVLPDEVVYNTNVLDRQQRKMFNQLSPNAGMTENPELVKTVLQESEKPEVKRQLAIDYLNEEATKDGVDINAVDIPTYIKDKRQAVQQQVVGLINEAGKGLENIDRDVDITNIDLVVNQNPAIKEKLDEVKKLDNYLVELTKYADDINAKRAFEKNPTDYKAIGRERRKLNDYSNVQRKELSIERGTENEKNKDLRETEDYNDELLGLQTAAQEIQQKVAAGEMKEEDAAPLMLGIHEQNRTLEKRYPSVALDNLRVYLGDKLAEKRKANDGAGMTAWNAIVSAAPSESELKKLIEDAKKEGIEITPEQEQQLVASKNKIPALSIAGHGYKSLILAPSMALNSWVGNDEANIEKAKEYRDPSMYMAEQPQGIAAPERLDESDKKVVRIVNNPEAGKKANWNSRATLNNIAETAGVITSYALLNKGFGAVAEKALGGIAGAETVGYGNALKPIKALSEAQRNIASNVLSSTFLNYHNGVDLMKQYTDDKNAQKAYGMASSIVTGLIFSELNPNKIFRVSEGVEKSAAEKFLQDFKAGKGTLEPEKFKQWVVNYVENIEKDLGHNVSLIKANQIADIALQGLTDKSSLKGRNLDEEVFGDLPSEIIALAPISAIAGYKKTKSESGLRNAVRMAIADPVNFEEGMAKMVEQGKISPEEAAQKVEYVKGLVKTTNSADLKTERVSALPEEKKFQYAANITKEANLKEKAKGLSDKLQVDEYNQQIEQLQGERKIMLLQNELGDKNYRDLTEEEKAKIELPKNYVTVKTQPVQSEESDNHVPVLVNSKGEHEIIRKSFKTSDEAKVYGEDVAKKRYFNETISNKQPFEQIETAETLFEDAKKEGKLGIFASMPADDAIKVIAEQAQNVAQGGSSYDAETAKVAYESTVRQFGKELVDAAIEKYPAKKETSVVVEPPLQQPEPITIGANETTQEPIKPTEPILTKEEPEAEGAGGEPPKTPVDNKYLYEGSKEERKRGLLKHLMSAEKIPDYYKEGLEKKGLEYKVANMEEAASVAKSMVKDMGRDDALEAARSGLVHPSVGSAIYAEGINEIYRAEQVAREKGDIEAADKLAQQWADLSMEYAEENTGKGQFTSQTAHFYRTSPMGIVMRNKTRMAERFKKFFENKEEGYKEVFEELIKSDEGKLLVSEEVEKVRKQERQVERKKRDKKIDDFFDGLKAKGDVLYSAPIPPSVWNGAMDVMKAATKAGDRVVDAVKKAIEHISKNIGDEWDKEKFRKEYEERLSSVADVKVKSEPSLEDKRKSFLEKFSKKLKGLNEKEKEQLIQKSMKKLLDNGALEYDEFKKIIAEVIGIKEFTPEQVKRVGELTKTINELGDIEDKMVSNPTKETISAYDNAVKNNLEAQMELSNLTNTRSDIVGTLKSIFTGGLLGVPSLIKNMGQSVSYLTSLKLPKSVIKQVFDLGAYGIAKLRHDWVGGEAPQLRTNILLGQKGFFSQLGRGIKSAAFDFNKGTVRKDYFSTKEFQSTLSPRTAVRELKLWKAGELNLTKAEVADRVLRSTLGWQPDFILRGMSFGDMPVRHAAEGHKAIQVAVMELGLNDSASIEAFMRSPKKFANKVFLEQGKSEKDAAALAEQVEKEIIKEGEKAVLQEDNWLSKASEWTEKALRVNKTDSRTSAAAKNAASLLKTKTLPFIKIPANAYWNFFKAANPIFTLTLSGKDAAMSRYYEKKGDAVRAREYSNRSSDNFAHAIVGFGLAALAKSWIQGGNVRTSNDDETSFKESEGERVFGKQNQLNLGNLMGGEDYWVDLSWFGPLGTILDTQARLEENRKKKALKGDKEVNGYMDDLVDNMSYSSAASLNSLVFDQAAKAYDAFTGDKKARERYFAESVNNMSNMVTGATIPAISKAMQSEEVRIKGDDVWQTISNDMKYRNPLYAMWKGQPPSKISIWGEPIKKDNSIKGVVGNMLGFQKGVDESAFGLVIYDDFVKSQNTGFLPQPVSDKIEVNNKSVQLSQKEADDLKTYVGQARKKLVEPLINNKVSVSDGKVYSQLTSDDEKIAALKTAYELGREIGMKQFTEQYPQYKKHIKTREERAEKRENSAEQRRLKKQLQSGANF